MPANPKLNAFLQTFSTRVAAINEAIGKAVSWLVLLMVLVIVYDVSMRYLFHIGSVLLQELEWHLFDIIFLLGAAYTFKENGHVSIDIFYHSRFVSEKSRLRINIVGTILFLIPFCLLVIITSSGFVENAYSISEGSSEPGGLPYRFLIYTMIPLGFTMVLLQGICFAINSALALQGLSQKGGS